MIKHLNIRPKFLLARELYQNGQSHEVATKFESDKIRDKSAAVLYAVGGHDNFAGMYEMHSAKLIT